MVWREATLAILLSLGLLPRSLHAQATQTAQTTFTFTQVDLDLLRQSDQLDDYLERQGRVFDDAATTKYVESVGRSLLPPGPLLEHVTWKFHVRRSTTPYALARPNGSIYISTGLLSLMQNEAQLASVLGHEETHVIARHPYLENRDIRAGRRDLPSGVITSIVPALQVASDGYRAEFEHQADMAGLRAMEAAGYDPAQMAETLRLLEKSAETDSSDELYTDRRRLEARINYLTEELQEHPPASSAHVVNASVYSGATETVCQHDIGLEIAAFLPRRAVGIALRLTDNHPTSRNYVLLGDAYRAMGGRLADPSDEQLSAEKKEEKQSLSKMTPEEYERASRDTPEGRTYWQDNRKKAKAAYENAIELDPSNGEAHRGLGEVYENEGNNSGAITEYQKYIDLAPRDWDRVEIQERLASFELPSSPGQPAGPALARKQDRKVAVRSILILPPDVSILKTGYKSPDPEVEHEKIEDVLSTTISDALSSHGCRVAASPFTRDALNADSDSKYALADLQRKLDGLEWNLHMSRGDVRKGRFTIGAAVNKVNSRSDVDALVFTSGYGQEIANHLAWFTTHYLSLDVAVVDAHTGSVLYYGHKEPDTDDEFASEVQKLLKDFSCSAGGAPQTGK